jgi:hypothetical protein
MDPTDPVTWSSFPTSTKGLAYSARETGVQDEGGSKKREKEGV